MAETGVIQKRANKPSKPSHDRIAQYKQWLRDTRALKESTIHGHEISIQRLLPSLGDDPSTYSAKRIQQVISAEGSRCSSSQIRIFTCNLRSYLRFLAAMGLCHAGLEHAVPKIAHWSLSTLPKYLPAEDIERILAVCTEDADICVRDCAIILLLTRLGLRAGDIISMKLQDIDWDAGTVRVCGKSRRSDRLPLPQDVGDAILSYLRSGRPDSDSPHVFLTRIAPYKPIQRSGSISGIVSKAIQCAGIEGVPSMGANILRHSTATSLLRSGAPLEAVSSLLRHQTHDMTTYYAKVDIANLKTIAQPWPGETTC